MFAKALLIGLWGAIVDGWAAFRLRRQRDGLELRLDQKSGTYRVHDWTAHVGTGFLYARNAIYAVFIAWWVFLAYVLISGDRETFMAVWTGMVSL